MFLTNRLALNTPIPHMVDFNFQTKIKNKQKTSVFKDNHYQQNTYLAFTEIPPCGLKLKQIRASSGPGRIFWFINITEFLSTRTLLGSKERRTFMGTSSYKSISRWNGKYL